MNDGFNPNFYQNPYFNPNFPQMNPGFNPNFYQNPYFNPNFPQMNPGFNPNFPQNPYFNPNFPQMNPGFNQGVQQNNPEPVQKPELVQPVAPQMNENKAEIYSTDSHQHAISGTLNKETEKNIQDIVHQTLNKDHKQAATSNAVPQSND
jgi:hypothetical protein